MNPITASPWPVSDILEVPKACAAEEALTPGDPRRVDVESLQYYCGLDELKSALGTNAASGFHFRCICGHRGSGKSTEMLELAQWASAEGYFPVRIVVNEYFGNTVPLSTDLFWLMTVAAEKAVNDAGRSLPQDAMRSVVKWFAEVVDEDKNEIKSEISTEATAQIGASAFSFAKLFAKLSASIKAGSTHSETIRLTLRRRPDALRDLTNEVLDSAAAELRQCGYHRGVLVIFDNLDRLDPSEVRKNVLDSCDLLRQARCHALLIVPIALALDDTYRLDDDLEPAIILPMLALRSVNNPWSSTVANSAYDPKAVALLLEVLRRRVDVSSLFERESDAELLVRMSGGCLRDLMHLVTRAVFARAPNTRQLTSEAVRLAIVKQRQDLRLHVQGTDWQTLTALKRRGVNVDTAVRNRLLHLRAALSYRTPESEVWYDVHPLLVETDEFQDAYRTHA